MICPDSPVGAERDCWKSKEDDEPAEGVDIIAWLKAEMLDGLDHEFAHDALGPAIFGTQEDGTPNFEVYRNATNKTWCVRAKSDFKPAEMRGIIGDTDGIA